MDRPPRFEFTNVVSDTSLRNSLVACWQRNQLVVSWSLLLAPLVVAMLYGAFFHFLFPYVIISPISICAAYLIYRSTVSRLKVKSGEVEAMSRLHLATAEALATAIDAKDQTTHCHVRRVQIYAAGMGEVFGLSHDEIAALKAGALLHDIGKLAVPPHILNKPGPLTHAEFEKMKIHTVVGAQILGRVDFPYPVIPIIRHHHEQWDGLGYPDKLKGEQIPITARIISVVDCFDSVREDRPFRRGMTTDEATALLLRGSGTHFDPKVVDEFIKHLPEFDAEMAAYKRARALDPTWFRTTGQLAIGLAETGQRVEAEAIVRPQQRFEQPAAEEACPSSDEYPRAPQFLP